MGPTHCKVNQVEGSRTSCTHPCLRISCSSADLRPMQMRGPTKGPFAWMSCFHSQDKSSWSSAIRNKLFTELVLRLPAFLQPSKRRARESSLVKEALLESGTCLEFRLGFRRFIGEYGQCTFLLRTHKVTERCRANHGSPSLRMKTLSFSLLSKTCSGMPSQWDGLLCHVRAESEGLCNFLKQQLQLASGISIFRQRLGKSIHWVTLGVPTLDVLGGFKPHLCVANVG